MKKLMLLCKKKAVMIPVAILVAAAITCTVVLAVRGQNIQPAGTEPAASTPDLAEVSALPEETEPPAEEPEQSEPEEPTEPEKETPAEDQPEEPNESEDQPEEDTSSEPMLNSWLEDYVPTAPEPGEIDPELKKEIQNAWYEQNREEFETNSQKFTVKPTPDALAVERYLGTYNGCVVARLYDPWSVGSYAVWYQQIGDVVLFNANWRDPDVYKDGNFYLLNQAYENGWLTDADLKNIAYYDGASIIPESKILPVQ